MKEKNLAAVMLGKKSAEKQREKLGKEGFKARMKEISHKRKVMQKSFPQVHI